VAEGEVTELQKLIGEYDFDQFSRQNVTVHQCQAGYAPESVKEIVVWCIRPAHWGSFTLVDAATGRKVLAGELVPKGRNVWNRHAFIADVSKWKKEGTYRLNANLGSGYEGTSEPFEIRKDLYGELLEKATKHFFLKRCGITCHTHDAYLRSATQKRFAKILGHRDVTGGWHDAHDDNKWTVFIWHALYALSDVQDRISPNWQMALDEGLPYPLAEAWWEIAWLLKMQKKDGSLYMAVIDCKPFKEKGKWHNMPWGMQCRYNDLVDDDRWLYDDWGTGNLYALIGHPACEMPSTPEFYHAGIAAAMLNFARVCRAYDKRKSERVLAAALRLIRWVDKRKAKRFQHINVHACLALAKMNLLACGRKSYRAQVEAHIRAILELQRPEGHFHASKRCRGLEMYPREAGDDRVLVDNPFSYVMPLFEYLKMFPKGALAGDITRALEKFFALAKVLTAQSEFGHLAEWTLRKNPDTILTVHHGYSPYLMAMGSLAAQGAKLFSDPSLLTIAEKQLQWMLGANPRAMCFMNDVGYRRVNRNPIFCNRQGRDIKYGITTGIFRKEGQPPNYPNAGLSEEGGYESGAEETWINATGWFIYLLSHLMAPHRT
jgi:hypothetical protein